MRGNWEQRAFLRTCSGRMDLYSREWEQDGAREKEILAPMAENVPCAYSPVTRQEITRGEIAALKFSGKIFAPPDILVQPGMKILLRQEGREIRFVSCGLPVRYPSHQEICVRIEEWV